MTEKTSSKWHSSPYRAYLGNPSVVGAKWQELSPQMFTLLNDVIIGVLELVTNAKVSYAKASNIEKTGWETCV